MMKTNVMIKAAVKSKAELRAKARRKSIVLTIIVLSLLLILSVLSDPWNVSAAAPISENQSVFEQERSGQRLTISVDRTAGQMAGYERGRLASTSTEPLFISMT